MMRLSNQQRPTTVSMFPCSMTPVKNRRFSDSDSDDSSQNQTTPDTPISILKNPTSSSQNLHNHSKAPPSQYSSRNPIPNYELENSRLKSYIAQLEKSLIQCKLSNSDLARQLKLKKIELEMMMEATSKTAKSYASSTMASSVNNQELVSSLHRDIQALKTRHRDITQMNTQLLKRLALSQKLETEAKIKAKQLSDLNKAQEQQIRQYRQTIQRLKLSQTFNSTNTGSSEKKRSSQKSDKQMPQHIRLTDSQTSRNVFEESLLRVLPREKSQRALQKPHSSYHNPHSQRKPTNKIEAPSCSIKKIGLGQTAAKRSTYLKLGSNPSEVLLKKDKSKSHKYIHPALRPPSLYH